MDNLHFLKTLLTSGCEYWIAARREQNYRDTIRRPDSIWLISLPFNLEIDIHQNDDTILLKDIEELRRTYVNNIPITDPYPPFQAHQSLHDFYIGFPLKDIDIKQFMIKALMCGSNHISDYKKIIEEMTTPKTHLENA